MMKFVLAPFFALLAFFPMKEEKGFSVKKITSHHPYESQWESLHTPKEELGPVFNQHYSYLTSGYQSYVFLSADGKYVIKFFKQDHMKLDSFPKLTKKRKQKFAKKRATRQATYSSVKLAFEELSEQTQLVYIHLTKSDTLKKKLYIYDNKGKRVALELDRMEFVVQRYGELALDRFKRGESIDALKTLVASISSKGIVDKDMAIIKNYGFIGDTPFLIDVGSLKREANPCQLEALEWQIKQWEKGCH